MNPEVKEKWVTALRSGDYIKGTGMLRYDLTDGGLRFCCLGVLCDIHHKETGLGEWANHTTYSSTMIMDDSSSTSLPQSVVNWADLKGDSPNAGDKSLVFINDDENRSFVEIADLIEQNL